MIRRDESTEIEVSPNGGQVVKERVKISFLGITLYNGAAFSIKRPIKTGTFDEYVQKVKQERIKQAKKSGTQTEPAPVTKPANQ